MEEIWKDIKGYEGYYRISNMGRVFSTNPYHNANGRFVNPTDNGYGYLIVGLRKNNIRHNRYVHRLVAEAFLEKEDGKNYVNHKDFDRKNNCVWNLEWCTQKENLLHSNDRMKKPHRNKLPMSTGERYIRHRQNYYEFQLRQEKIYRCFKTLDEAIHYRDVVLKKEVAI